MFSVQACSNFKNRFDEEIMKTLAELHLDYCSYNSKKGISSCHVLNLNNYSRDNARFVGKIDDKEEMNHAE